MKEPYIVNMSCAVLCLLIRQLFQTMNVILFLNRHTLSRGHIPTRFNVNLVFVYDLHLHGFDRHHCGSHHLQKRCIILLMFPLIKTKLKGHKVIQYSCKASFYLQTAVLKYVLLTLNTQHGFDKILQFTF